MSNSYQSEIPKARVNIQLSLHTGNAQKKVELPLKLVVVGDYSNGAEQRAVSEREKININKKNFDSVLADFSPSVNLSVENTLAGDGSEENVMRTIVEMKLGQVSQHLHRHYGLTTHIDENLSDALTAACLLPDTGARNVDSLLNQQILPVLSQQLLTHMAAKQKPASLTLGWSEDEGIVLEFAHD
jgi:ATP-dependent Clp protease ATP-binding subunit ClpA